MSDSDAPDDKTGKPLTTRQQLRNLLNALLDEEGCPEKERMTTKERERWKEMRKAVDESRIDEAAAKDFIARLRGNLAEPEPLEISAAEIERVRGKIRELAAENFVSRMEHKLAKEAQRKKSKYID